MWAGFVLLATSSTHRFKESSLLGIGCDTPERNPAFASGIAVVVAAEGRIVFFVTFGDRPACRVGLKTL
jgi:hypothetical protein